MKTLNPQALLICILLLISLPSIGKERFFLLDDIGQLNKPNTSSLGFTEVRTIPTSSLWSKEGDLSEPDFPAIEAAIRKQSNPLGIICLDVEHWSTSTSDEK